MLTIRLVRSLNFGTLILVLLLVAFLVSKQAAGQPASPADIRISFKMNPSITRGIYMGDRWLLPPYYNVEEGKEITVEAIARGIDAQGKQFNISAAWEAGDPSMITISPDKGLKVKLTILKEGQTDLRVAFGGISKKLPVKAWYKDNSIHVEIGQPE